MINFRQQELIENFADEIEKRFPYVKFVDVTESPENPNDLWINVTRVGDEDKLIALLDFCSEKSTDILMDYGYHMLVMPVR